MAVQWIVWAALCISLAIYGLVSSQFSASGATEDWQQLALLRPLAIMSVVMLVLSHVFPRRVFKASMAAFPEPTLQMVRMRSFVPNIISWAFTESIAIYGLVLVMRVHNMMPYYIFAGVAALNMLLLRPNEEKWLEIARGQRPRHRDPNS